MRARRTAYVAVAAAALLLVTGCATTKTVGVSSVGEGAVKGDTNPSPGVTADKVRVGVIVTDTETLGKTLGFNTDPMGDSDKQVKALTEWVNANGGMGGRTLELVPKVYNPLDDSPQAEEALCRSWTQDEKVFGVVLTGQLQANARKCYAKGRTVMVDNAAYPLDRQGYDELAPFLWAPGMPVYEDFLPQWVTALKDGGLFEGAKRVGIVAADSPVNRRAYDTLLKPELEKAGVPAQEIGYVDTIDTNALNTSLFQIAQDFKQKGVDRVLFLGGARMAGLWFLSANINGINVPYGLSSYDTPVFFSRNPQLFKDFEENPATGSVGLSFQAGSDVEDTQYPFPSTFAEQQCASIYAKEGMTFTTRQQARIPFMLCDAVLFLKNALDRAPQDITPQSWGKAAASLAGSFQASSTYSTFLAADRVGGPASARPFKWDAGCQCMTITGDSQLLGGVPPDGGAASADAQGAAA